jgi:hypothetical protein
MPMFPYDDPTHSLFRVYGDWECEDGYPYIWNKMSEVRCEEKLFRCDDCGFAYLEEGDILTVHHNNLNKADCRRVNLPVYRWLHHSVDHEPGWDARPIRCRFCKTYFIGWPRLHRHIRGIHRPSELKIPAITLAKRPISYVGRGRVLAAIQQQQRWRELWWDA